MLLSDFSSLNVGEHRFSHDCKPNSRSKPLSVTVKPDGYVYVCHRCGETGCQGHEGTWRQPIATRSTQTHTTLSDFGRAIWNETQALTGIAVDYLTARHCLIPPADSDLRYHANLGHLSGYVGPALVGLVTDAISNEPISLHRTWIKADGTKAAVEPARMLLKGHRKAGGVIRLWPDDCVSSGLAIAEGLETALAAAHGFTPIWSTIDAGNLAKFPILSGIAALTIFADHDPAGIKAAKACAQRWADAAQVTVIIPGAHGVDVADELGAQ